MEVMLRGGPFTNLPAWMDVPKGAKVTIDDLTLEGHRYVATGETDGEGRPILEYRRRKAQPPTPPLYRRSGS